MAEVSSFTRRRTAGNPGLMGVRRRQPEAEPEPDRRPAAEVRQDDR